MASHASDPEHTRGSSSPPPESTSHDDTDAELEVFEDATSDGDDDEDEDEEDYDPADDDDNDDDDDDEEIEGLEEDDSDEADGGGDGSNVYVDARELLDELLTEVNEVAEAERAGSGAAPTTAAAATPTAPAEAGGEAAAAPPPQRRTLNITRHELLRLLTQRTFFAAGYPDDDDDDESAAQGYGGAGFRRRRPARDPADLYPKVPSEAGRALMESGEFGLNDRDASRHARRKRLAARLMRRELGVESRGRERSVNRIAAQSLVPSSKPDTIIHYNSRCYSGQFSDDGNFFFSCSQDFRVRLYDTSNPYSWRFYKSVIYPGGQWTITDASLSPDNKFLAYSSITPIVALASTDPDSSEPHLLHLAMRGGNPRDNHFGIWSIRFSGDGREIVAGTSNHCVYVYDLETRQSVLRIPGHDDDVNAVCYGDRSSPHILYSGSDDSTVKVWDRRSLGDSREAGVFIGHTEGLTYVDSKGDGRYVLSNAKDQTMKLWDLRKMVATERAERIDPRRYTTHFDYRFQDYEAAYFRPNPHDCSLVTFRGHQVLQTLIRCHFSPPGSSDSRYVYTGSADGRVYIYNLDATLAGKLDVHAVSQSAGSKAAAEGAQRRPFRGGATPWRTCVRDASWHPNAPVLAATSWAGYEAEQAGTCTVHTWNDGMEDDEAEPKMGQHVNALLSPDLQGNRSAAARARGMRARAW